MKKSTIKMTVRLGSKIKQLSQILKTDKRWSVSKKDYVTLTLHRSKSIPLQDPARITMLHHDRTNRLITTLDAATCTFVTRINLATQSERRFKY